MPRKNYKPTEKNTPSPDLEMTEFKKTSNVQNDNDIVDSNLTDTIVPMHDDGGNVNEGFDPEPAVAGTSHDEDLQKVEVSTYENEMEFLLGNLQKQLTPLIQKNEDFHSDIPKISEIKEKGKVGILKKAAAFIKTDNYSHFDESVERRKLLTSPVIEETFQRDLTSLKEELASPQSVPNDYTKRVKKLEADIQNFEDFLTSSEMALKFEVRKSENRLTKKEVAASVFQGKEHNLPIVVRAFIQSLLSTGIGSASQVGFAVLKEKIFEDDPSQMTEKEAGELFDNFIKINRQTTETTETTTQSMSGGEEALSSEMINKVADEISGSEPAQLSLNLCENVYNHLEGLESFPETKEQFYEIVKNYLHEEIESLGRSDSHQLIKALDKCVDFTVGIKDVANPDSSYFDTSNLDYPAIVATDAMISMVRGAVLPMYDTLYEKSKVKSVEQSKSGCKKFNEEALKSIKNQFKGTAITLGIILAVKLATDTVKRESVLKDIAFNAIVVAANGLIDGGRSLTSYGVVGTQILKAILRTIISRGVPLVVKSTLVRLAEFPSTGKAAAIDISGALLGGLLKELNGAGFQIFANLPNRYGFLNSWHGTATVHEKTLFDALRRRVGDSMEDCPEAKKFLEESAKVKSRVSQSDKYLNQKEVGQMPSGSGLDSRTPTDYESNVEAPLEEGFDSRLSSSVREARSDEYTLESETHHLPNLLSTSNKTTSVAGASKDRKSESKKNTNVKGKKSLNEKTNVKYPTTRL